MCSPVLHRLAMIACLLPVPVTALAHLSLIRQGPESMGVIEAGDRHGVALAAGDFNGDGYDDLAMGAPGDDVNGVFNAGAVIVSFGSAFGITHVGAQLFTAEGMGQAASTSAQLGHSLAAGDLNGDGYDDLAIGAPNATVNGVAGQGEVYILYGSSGGLTYIAALIQSQAGGFEEADDNFGFSLAIGKFDGDPEGRADLAIGAPGEDGGAGAVFWFTGTGSAPLGQGFFKQADLGGSNAAGDGFGFALASGNLVSSTLRDDLAIGAPFRDVSGATDAGMVYLVPGSVGGLNPGGSSSYDADVVGTFQANGQFGYALAAAHFYDGDYDGLAIGEPGRNSETGRVIVGKGYVTGLGFSAGDGIALTQSQVGGVPQSGDRFGAALAGDPWWNPDGHDDLAIGAPGDGMGFTSDAGTVHVVPGTSLGPTGASAVAYNQGVLNEDAEQGDELGHALVFGRFDGTGRGNLAVGAPGERYEEVYFDPLDPDVRDESGAVHVIAPWRQTFGLSAIRSIAYDCESSLVFSHKPFDTIRIASTTKIMTVLLACEHVQAGQDPNELYTVPPWVANDIGGSQVPLFPCERLRLIDLMNTCLLVSGNDAAFAIADLLKGGGGPLATVPLFVAEMNQRAQDLGMTHTHFHNPAGLDKDPLGLNPGGHHSTPEDMAKLSRAAMENPLFRQIAGTLNYSWTRFNFYDVSCSDDGSDTPWSVNSFFAGIIQSTVQPATGIKGGCTKQAQLTGCFSAAQPNGLGGQAIVGHYTTPLVNNSCLIPVGTYAPDAANLLALALNECNTPVFFPLPPDPPKWALKLANAATQAGESKGAGSEMGNDGGVLVDVFRQAGSGPTSFRLGLTHHAQVLLDRGTPASLGIAPFAGHAGFTIRNDDEVERQIEVTLSTDPGPAVYTIGPRQSVAIPAHPSAAPEFTLTLQIVDAMPGSGELTVEGTYLFDLSTSAGNDGRPFFSASLRRPPSVVEGASIMVEGRDAQAGSEVFVAAHDPSLVVGVDDAPVAGAGARLQMLAPSPNPFRDHTRLVFDLGETANVEAEIYDVVGRRVKRYAASVLPPGRWGFEWNGTTDQGTRVRAGVYFCRVSMDGRKAGTVRVVLAH